MWVKGSIWIIWFWIQACGKNDLIIMYNKRGAHTALTFSWQFSSNIPARRLAHCGIALWKRKAKLLNNFPRSQLPPLITWNGVPNSFNIDYWKTTKQNDSSVPIPNSTKSLQINDSSATEATLRGLNRYVEYQTQISMCTAEGCGPKSVPWPLEGLSFCVPFERYFCSGRINSGLL